jgi:hypothetical protein
LEQDCQVVKGDLWQNNHNVHGDIFQNRLIVKGDLLQGNQYVEGNLEQDCQTVQGDLVQNNQKAVKAIVQDESSLDEITKHKIEEVINILKQEGINSKKIAIDKLYGIILKGGNVSE